MLCKSGSSDDSYTDKTPVPDSALARSFLTSVRQLGGLVSSNSVIFRGISEIYSSTKRVALTTRRTASMKIG